MAKHNRSKLTKELFNNQSGHCVYCEKLMRLELGHDDTVTKDHVKPKALGGEDDISNLVAACYKCNIMKGSMPIAAWLVIAMEMRLEERRKQEAGNDNHKTKDNFRVVGYSKGHHCE